MWEVSNRFGVWLYPVTFSSTVLSCMVPSLSPVGICLSLVSLNPLIALSSSYPASIFPNRPVARRPTPHASSSPNNRISKSSPKSSPNPLYGSSNTSLVVDLDQMFLLPLGVVICNFRKSIPQFERPHQTSCLKGWKGLLELVGLPTSLSRPM